jgi:apolipoprotein N-acyltransferase
MVIDPYDRIIAEGPSNERGIIMGETFRATGQALFTRRRDWFGEISPEIGWVLFMNSGSLSNRGQRSS